MPPPNPPRPRPSDDDDFEVVDEAPPPKPARPLPPLPGQPAAKPAPRPAPPAAKAPLPVARAAPKPAPRPAAKPAFEVVDDTEVEVSAKSRTAEVRKPARAARADDDDDRPRKKKAKKGGGARTGDDYADEVREQRLREFEYTWPTVFLVLGVGMAVTGAIGSGGGEGALSVILVIAGLFFSIPVSIATLMGVGLVCGINYGRFGPAILKIAAVTFVVNGVYFLCEWFKVPIFIAGPIGCAAAFGLFKTMFDLDNGETNTSMGAINVVSFLLKWLVIVVVAIIVAKSGGKVDLDDGGGSGSGQTWRDRGSGPGAGVMPDDEPEDPDDP
ncbi:hypothetical protein [Urbifossiella limnaea]|uniref:Uncharacterized protein n=1 Tax=Urbifossiella limnaea TaxID=2528023 RepID=A0A517Y3E9_9BACT|nr:hypothetical protein [Urbifossiella limnaea]QDU24261.1 hypothetical protein ETAA1_62750 [Urbifossiella limnaea]